VAVVCGAIVATPARLQIHNLRLHHSILFNGVSLEYDGKSRIEYDGGYLWLLLMRLTFKHSVYQRTVAYPSEARLALAHGVSLLLMCFHAISLRTLFAISVVFLQPLKRFPLRDCDTNMFRTSTFFAALALISVTNAFCPLNQCDRASNIASAGSSKLYPRTRIGSSGLFMSEDFVQETPDMTQERIGALVENHPVLLFMKGSKLFPQCGFSNTAVQILNSFNIDFHTVDVLSDSAIRSGVKDFSQWPTIPQLYVAGEFIGGSDIMIEMYQNGELGEMIEKTKADMM
jgi:monothiol glutaredoxin